MQFRRYDRGQINTHTHARTHAHTHTRSSQYSAPLSGAEYKTFKTSYNCVVQFVAVVDDGGLADRRWSVVGRRAIVVAARRRRRVVVAEYVRLASGGGRHRRLRCQFPRRRRRLAGPCRRRRRRHGRPRRRRVAPPLRERIAEDLRTLAQSADRRSGLHVDLGGVPVEPERVSERAVSRRHVNTSSQAVHSAAKLDEDKVV